MLCVLCAIVCAVVSVNRYSVMKRRAAESARRRDALKSEIEELIRQKEAQAIKTRDSANKRLP
jgi:hypothetical protein